VESLGIRPELQEAKSSRSTPSAYLTASVRVIKGPFEKILAFLRDGTAAARLFAGFETLLSAARMLFETSFPSTCRTIGLISIMSCFSLILPVLW
jgi:hypothetical protein